MAVGTLVSVEEYLHTSYRPDCDYVDGEIQDRLWGEFSHGRAMGQILVHLSTRSEEHTSELQSRP